MAREPSPTVWLHRLERVHAEPGSAAREQRLALLRRLDRVALGSAAAVQRLHELACRIRAYADDAAVQAAAVRLLARFHRRADLRRYADELADSGIAGTAIRYRFFAQQAQWLAAHWPGQLRIDREAVNAATDQRLAQALPSMLEPVVMHALIERHAGGLEAVDALRPRGTTDAAFVLAAIAGMPGSVATREAVSDAIDLPYVLEAAPSSPSRTQACFARAPVVLRGPRASGPRPDLRAEIARAPRRVVRLAARDGQALADLARAAMVTRARSLEAFSSANPHDAWLVDDGDGLAFGLIGVRPDRRHPVASWYGGLTLRNGVPIGYSQADFIGPTAALSFNTFETYRGGEAAHCFARWLAALHHHFGARSFSIEPYQLGANGNDEGLMSGAWWFYAKLGFEPRNAMARRLAAAERERLARRAGARSSAATLRRLAAAHLYFEADGRPPHPRIDLMALGLAAGRRSAAEGLDAAPTPASRSSLPSWAESLLPRTAPAGTRRALAAFLQAKAGVSEIDAVRACPPEVFDALSRCHGVDRRVPRS